MLVHEFARIIRRDYLIILLATILRDAFFYLPTSRIVYRQMQHKKELVCDEGVIRVTHRPLALTKVWLQAVDRPGFVKFGAAQSLLEVNAALHSRIQRVLTLRNATVEARFTRTIEHCCSSDAPSRSRWEPHYCSRANRMQSSGLA